MTYLELLFDISNNDEEEVVFFTARLYGFGFDSFENKTNLLKNLGRPIEAELSIRKSIEINPSFSIGHLNLSSILQSLGKIEEASIYEWKAIEMKISSPFITSYRENAKLINKIAFYVFGLNNFNHIKPILEINPSLFEIIVQENIDKEKIIKIRNDINSTNFGVIIS